MTTRRIVIAWSLLAALLVLAACGPSMPGTTTAPTATPTSARLPVPQGATMGDIPEAPTRDPFDLAQRYLGVPVDPLPHEVLYAVEPLGSSRSFWILDPVEPSVNEVQATLRHVSEHAVWWIDDNLTVDETALGETARRFDEEVYPHVIETFGGGTPFPGPIAVVTTQLNGLAGYFSAADALPRAVYPYSNERVSVFMAPGIGSDRYLGTLAHEFQHAVHWLADPDEETWTNEGLAEFAARSLGLPALPYTAYLRDPQVPLVHWPADVGNTLPSYAGASLFAHYLAQRTGIENLNRFVAEPADGIAGIEAYLRAVAPGLSFDALFADWLVANVVGATSGDYSYGASLGVATVQQTQRGPAEGTVELAQFSAWYMRVDPGSSPLSFHFQGRTATALLPVVPHSGRHCWWGNRGDSINSTLTRALDLSGVDSATLRFWTWFDIEEHWDHGYVAVSTDGGTTWTALAGRHTTTSDPLGVKAGPSYTGKSGRWLPERIDLSPYAGSEVLLRFEQVNDEAIDTPGWCIDDIEVPEIGYFDDVEAGADGWEADGFVRLSSGGVRQQFIVRVVKGSGDDAQVIPVTLDERNRGTAIIDRPAILVVSPMAPSTSLPTVFTYRLTR